MNFHEYVILIGNRLAISNERKDWREYLRLTNLLKETIEETLPKIADQARKQK